RSALNRFMEYLHDGGADPGVMTSDQIATTALEEFYAWLLVRPPADGQQPRARKRSAITYVAGLRAFLAFLDRRRWLHPDVSYERMREGARTLIGKTPYPTPRVGEEVALVVTHVN